MPRAHAGAGDQIPRGRRPADAGIGVLRRRSAATEHDAVRLRGRDTEPFGEPDPDRELSIYVAAAGATSRGAVARGPGRAAAAAAAGGRLYVIGGFDVAGSSLRTVYVFDGHTWKAGPRLPLGLDHAAAATLDDRLYLSGGHSGGADSARVFRLDGASWTELSSMRHARGGHALIAAGGRLYAVGGNTAAGNVAPVEVYDPPTRRWSDIATLPDPRNHVAGFAFGTEVCVAGGRSPNTTRVDCFNYRTRDWSRLANLPQPTSGAGAATLGDGTVIVMGGEDAQESSIVNQLARLPSTRRWTAPERMLVPRHGFQLALFDGRAWACGGGASAGLHPVATCTSVL